MKIAHVVLLALLLAGCGSSTPAATAPETQPIAAPDPAAQHRQRQSAACEAMCNKGVQCQIDALEASEPADEVAALDLVKMHAENTKECADGCRATELSPRQVRVYEVCVREEEACEPFIACLEHARPAT